MKTTLNWQRCVVSVQPASASTCFSSSRLRETSLDSPDLVFRERKRGQVQFAGTVLRVLRTHFMVSPLSQSAARQPEAVKSPVAWHSWGTGLGGRLLFFP